MALKVLPETFASDPYRLARFQREAEVLASLNHQNIDNSYRSNFLTIREGYRRDEVAVPRFRHN